jgi:transketolase C-terminal domain/subunit
MKAFDLIDEFEQKVNDSTYHKQSVLKNISMHDVFEDLRTMLDYPNSTIIGNSGHYCSVAVVLNWLLNNQPKKYTKAVLELTYYGETSFEEGKIKVAGETSQKN